MTKTPSGVDKHVATQVRARRQVLGMTQQALADAIGVTFQQVQKYEKGTNRISSSRLLDVAQALRVPVSYFFEGSDKAGAGAQAASESLIEQQSTELLRAFRAIRRPAMRKAILELAKVAAGK